MYIEWDNDTNRLQKSVYIHTFVFTGTYMGPFFHNPVESRLILLDSSSIPLESSGFLWNPVESGRMDAFLQESVGHQKVQAGGGRSSRWRTTVRGGMCPLMVFVIITCSGGCLHILNVPLSESVTSPCFGAWYA